MEMELLAIADSLVDLRGQGVKERRSQGAGMGRHLLLQVEDGPTDELNERVCVGESFSSCSTSE
jgi:hypothetical protein